MHAGGRGLDIVDFAPAGLGSARTVAELRERLSGTLRALFHARVRYQVYFADECGELVLDSRFADRGGTGRGSLLASLRWRLLLEGSGDVGAAVDRLPALHGLRAGGMMCAPLVDARARVGLLVLEAAPDSPGFTTIDLQLLECIAGLLSSALLRQRSPEAQACAACVERVDRATAGQVQRRLMRTSLPAGIGVTVDAKYLPALDVGGDFYELSDLGDGKVGCAIGDVSGKGVSAALIMSRVSSEVRRAFQCGANPSAVLQTVNEGLTDVDDETFVTASCLRLDSPRRTLTVANAGHIPLMVRRASGEVFSFGAASGTPLGIIPCEYADEDLDLEPRDIVLLMTDGLVEALDRPGDRMGAMLLHEIVGAAPHDPKVINGRILEAADAMRGDQPPDDTTLVALQIA